MAHYLVVGKNTYVTEAEATAYLESRLRSATLWPALPSTTKLAALSSAFYLLETMWSWKGTKTGVVQVATVSLVAGGTGYAIGNVVTLVGGAGEAAQVEVLTVSSGAIATYRLVRTGYYTTAPSGTVGVTGGSGSGATFSFTTHAQQQTDWPRSGTGVDLVVDALVPEVLKQAQAVLAFELTQDADLETAANAHANTKRMKVSSLEIEYFRAQFIGRFPPLVTDLIADLIDQGSSSGGPVAYGIDGETAFPDDNPFGRVRPW